MSGDYETHRWGEYLVRMSPIVYGIQQYDQIILPCGRVGRILQATGDGAAVETWIPTPKLRQPKVGTRRLETLDSDALRQCWIERVDQSWRRVIIQEPEKENDDA